jgi:hypothetical protein
LPRKPRIYQKIAQNHQKPSFLITLAHRQRGAGVRGFNFQPSISNFHENHP